jgi:cell division septum initiation protein DivIVA
MVSVQSSDDSMIAVASQREELQQQHEEEAQRILKELERAEIKIEEPEY